MFTVLVSLVCIGIIGYAIGKHQISSTEIGHSRQKRFFPFYTIGRLPNDVCTGSNRLLGTCLIRGECRDNGGISTGSCSQITNQAVCCVYQLTCSSTTSYNNTYFYNNGYPGVYTGNGKCSIIVEPCNENICQLRIDFLAFSLAPPNGNGDCITDFISITGGSSRVPRICGENTGQHVYVDFDGESPITITVYTTSSYTFNRQWQLLISQIACNSPYKAPSGCLQYYLDESGTVMSFNYASSASSLPNSIGVDGTRQLSNQQYGICIRMGANRCGIKWSQIGSDMYSFTITDDVNTVDPALIGTQAVQMTNCTTDYIIIPNPIQGGISVGSDRFCGLGLADTTSFTKPFVLYVVTDGNESQDIGNRGFKLSYLQNSCPVTQN